MNEIEIYTKPHCPYCHRAKALLNAKGLDYQEYDVSNDGQKYAEMKERSQRTTVPQVFVNNLHIGGSDDLVAADRSGQLDALTEHLQNPIAISN